MNRKRIKNRKKVFTLTCVVILMVLIISIIASGHNLRCPRTFGATSVVGSSDSVLDSRGAENINEDFEYKTATEFATGSNRVTIKGIPTGKTTYLAIPPTANVTSATMQVLGRMPDTINKYAFGGRHSYISGADFNMDGNMDILTTDKDNNSVYILLNDGNSNIYSIKDYPTGDLPLQGTINDFNNNGYPDFAVVNQGGNSFTVLQNSANGDAKFKNRKDYKIGDWARDITSADLNNDGWTDIASITSNDYKLWINLNLGNETLSFSEAVNYSTEVSPVGIESGDLNNDGFVDLVIINVGANLTVNGARYYYSASVLKNKGNAEFLPMEHYIVGKSPAGIEIDDFNNDGWLDIATSNRGGYNVSILLNKGNGKFSNAINYSLIDRPYSGRNLRTGDVDGDGDIDIVSVSSKMNTVEVLKNRGDGTFEEYIDYSIPNRPVDLFLADFDNDGDLDASICSQTDGSITIVPNNGHGEYCTFKFYFTGTRPQGIAHGDFNSDGYIDLTTANYLSGTLTIKFNDGNGIFEEDIQRLVAVEPFAVTVGDINKDGHLDIVTADEALFKVIININEGEGKFSNPTIGYDIGGFPYSILFHDLNGDGENELITGNNAQLSISILRNLGNISFAPFVDYSFENQYPFGLAAGDMDGDGDEDIICTNFDINLRVKESNISIIWNEGNGTFISHKNYGVGNSPISVKVSDLDLDGDLDIVVANKDSNTTTILMNLDNSSFGNRRDYTVGPSPSSVAIDDFNNDGYPDIVISNQLNDSISILYNLGNGTFKSPKEYLIGAGPIFITGADFNSDGKIDFATSNLLTHSVSVRMDTHYPGNISVDIFSDGIMEVTHPGVLSKAINISDFSDKLNSYLAVHNSEVVTLASGAAVLVPINVSSTQIGMLELQDLEINYIIPKDFDGDLIPDHSDTDDDNDGIPDDWEDSYGLNPKYLLDGSLDKDNDNLTNLEEYLNKTNPKSDDSDYDGLFDGDEVKTYGTDPLDEDSDDDNMDDNWEHAFGLDPLEPSDAKVDADNDGYTNLEEYEDETDPTDVNDHPGEPADDVCFTPGFSTTMMIISISLIIIGVYFRNKIRNHLK